MKKILLLSFLLCAALFTNAQSDKGDSNTRAEKMAARLADKLDLSTEQQSEIQTLLIEQQDKRKARGKDVRTMSVEERTALKDERKADKTAFDERMATILSPDQYEAYQNLPKKRRGKGGAKNGKGKGGAKKGKGKSKKSPEERAQKRVEGMTEKLNLSEAQQTQVYDLLIEQAPPKGSATDWKNLSKEEREAHREQRKADREAFKTALAEILTPEQLATHEELKEGNGEEKGKKGKKRKKGKKGRRF